MSSITVMPSRPPEKADGRDRPPEEIVTMIGDYIGSLPADRFPNIVATSAELMSGGPDERFQFGLDVTITGLAAQVGR